MLTIFSTPKAFTDPHINKIQRNAIESWLRLPMEKEIILCCDDPGVEDVCKEYGIKHAANVATNEYGTPLINDIFAQAEAMASGDWMCYINTDILVYDDFVEAVNVLRREAPSKGGFMASGRRVRVDVLERLVPSAAAPDDFKGLPLDSPSALDYFIFPKGFYAKMPPFAIGRFWWDSYLALFARHSPQSCFIDLSHGVKVFHQNHDYNHFGQEGNDFAAAKELQSNGVEAKANFENYFRCFPGKKEIFIGVAIASARLVEGRLEKQSLLNRTVYMAECFRAKTKKRWYLKPFSVALNRTLMAYWYVFYRKNFFLE